MRMDDIKSRLRELGELKIDGLREELLKVLKLHECTRHLIIWSDHSSIMNHGHLLLTVNAIYDPAFYYTSEELHGKNVQELVEKPHIYIMARYRDAIEDQLLYSETRLEDINELGNQLLSSQKVSIRDICRFFHGIILRKRWKGESRLVVVLGAVDALGHQPAILTMWVH